MPQVSSGSDGSRCTGRALPSYLLVTPRGNVPQELPDSATSAGHVQLVCTNELLLPDGPFCRTPPVLPPTTTHHCHHQPLSLLGALYGDPPPFRHQPWFAGERRGTGAKHRGGGFDPALCGRQRQEWSLLLRCGRRGSGERRHLTPTLLRSPEEGIDEGPGSASALTRQEINRSGENQKDGISRPH